MIKKFENFNADNIHELFIFVIKTDKIKIVVAKEDWGGIRNRPIDIKSMSDLIENSYVTSQEADKILDNVYLRHNDDEEQLISEYGDIPKIVKIQLVAKEVNDEYNPNI